MPISLCTHSRDIVHGGKEHNHYIHTYIYEWSRVNSEKKPSLSVIDAIFIIIGLVRFFLICYRLISLQMIINFIVYLANITFF